MRSANWLCVPPSVLSLHFALRTLHFELASCSQSRTAPNPKLQSHHRLHHMNPDPLKHPALGIFIVAGFPLRGYDEQGDTAMNPLLESHRKAIVKLCKRYGVKRLEAFGSALGESFDPEHSDLDLLIEFEPMPAYARVDAYFGILDELRSLLDRQIDLVMIGAVKNPYIAQHIERTKQLLYAA